MTEEKTKYTTARHGLKETFKFHGFTFPSTTPVPDQIFDELLPLLSGAELKVLLYITRRTFGFKKESDRISLSQITSGITKANGDPLDYGTGLNEWTVLKALKSLRSMNIIVAHRNYSPNSGDQPTSYALNLAGTSLTSVYPHKR